MTNPNGIYILLPDGKWHSGSVTWDPLIAPPVFTRFTPGSVKPIGYLDAGKVNVGPRIAVTRYDGDITIATGQTYSGLDIYGKVTFSGKGTLVDCIVRGPVTSLDPTNQSPTSDCSMVIGTGNDLKGSLISFCRLDATGRESPWKDGIRGGNYTMEYSEIIRANDAIGAMATGNATIKCCRISRGYYTAWLNSATGSPYAGNPTSPNDRTSHSDGVQVQGYSGWVFDGCYIGGSPQSGATNIDHTANRDWAIPAQRTNISSINGGDHANSGFIIQNNVGASNPCGVIVRNCWVAGGAARFNLVPTSGTDMLAGVQILNNRIIRPTWTGNYVTNNILNNGSNATSYGNVFDDTGLAVTISAPNTTVWTPGAVIPLGYGEALPAAAVASPATWSPSGASGAAVGTTVGCQTMTSLIRFDGDITLANGHTIYSGLDIYGRVLGRCTDSISNPTHVCLLNCKVRGDSGNATSITACATGTSFDFGAAVFNYVSFDCTGRTNFYKDGVDGGGYTANYCELRAGVDGAGINAVGNVTLNCCRIWDSTYFAWYNTATGTAYPGSPSQSSRDTHNDGVQWQTGKNVTITGCFIGGFPYYNNTPLDAGNKSIVDPLTTAGADILAQVNQGTDYKTSGLMIQNSVGGSPTLAGSITYCWIAGGAARINIGTVGNADKMAGVTINRNKFFKTTLDSPRIVSSGYDIYKISDCAAIITNNTYVVDGTAVSVVAHA